MGGSKAILAGVVLSVLVVGLVFWALWSGDRPLRNEPSKGVVAEPDLDLEPEEKKESESADELEADQTVAVPTGGALRGTVYLDDSTTPADGASVVAIDSGTRDYAERTLTDESGRYTLSELEAGSYRVTAWRGAWTHRAHGIPEKYEVFPGETTNVDDITLVPGITIRGQVVEEGSENPLEGIRVRFAGRHAFTDAEGSFVLEGLPAGTGGALVARGEFHAAKLIQVQTVAGDEPFVRIELARGGVIHGVVTDHEGKPAEGVSVRAVAGNVGHRETTDAGGRYRLQGLPLDAHGLTVTASRDGRFETTGTVPGFSPGTNEFRLDLQLEPGFTLAGRVVDESRAPVAGAEFYIDWSGWEVLAESNADGAFVIDGATDRMHMLTARKKGYGPVSLSLKGLEADAREEIELVLPGGHTVGGRVLDEQGEPVAQAWVYIDTMINHAGPYPSTVCDEEGRFSFEDLPADLEEIGALKQGYVDSRDNPVTAGDQNLKIVLEEAGVIEGVVVDASTGAPVFPTTIKMTFSDDPRYRSSRRGGISSLLVRRGVRFNREDGSFRLAEDLRPDGHYKLIVIAEDYADGILPDVAAWRLSEEREPLRVLLERGESILGTVVSASGGQPLEGVKIHHLPKDRRGGGYDYWREVFRGDGRAVRATLTDEKGSFELAGIRPELGTLLLEKPGYARTAIEGVLPSPNAQAIELADEALLMGSVTGLDGEPLAAVAIRVELDGQIFGGGVTDQNGAYRVAGLPAGGGQVSFRGRDTLERKERANLVAGEVTALDISFAGGSITGRATLAGEPVPGARVHVMSLDDTAQQQHLQAGADGAFRVQGLKPGTYRLTARRPEDRRGFYEGAVATVAVTSGEAICEIEFPTGRLAGHVVESGRPIAGVHVALTRKMEREFFKGMRRTAGGEWVPYDRKDLAGSHKFDFDALEPGVYFITVARAQNQSVAAWAGPFKLARDGAILGIVVELAGERRLSVRAIEEGTAQPIEHAWASLQPLDATAVRIGGERTEGGKTDFTAIPGGRYVLNVESSEYVAHTEEVDLTKTDAELEIRLKPATWIVLELDGPTVLKEGHRVVATVLSGGDPDWRWISSDGRQPKTISSYDLRYIKEPRIRIKTRPGEYRIRFEIAPVRTTMDESPLIDEARSVIVPEKGEVKLQYTIPEG